jgi:hypothetical protein
MVERRLLAYQEQVVRRVVAREEFGNGPAGDYSYLAVKNGEKCEAIDPELNIPCNNFPEQTVDFDILGNMEVIPICSDKCAGFAQEIVERDLTAQNMVTIFGRNGFGREKS